MSTPDTYEASEITDASDLNVGDRVIVELVEEVGDNGFKMEPVLPTDEKVFYPELYGEDAENYTVGDRIELKYEGKTALIYHY